MYIEEILENLIVFETVTQIIEVTLGAGLCFGALKWRKGLITTTAIGWGAVLGLILSVALLYSEIISDYASLLYLTIIGAILLPILTYSVPGVNRFIVGFIVSSKILTMLTTVLAKEGTLDIIEALMIPIIGGLFIGILLMAWTQMRISAFVLSCAFIGASDIAPTVSEWINRIIYAHTGDPSILIDPIDLLFAVFGVELTDIWTLLAMIALMIFGCYFQIKRLHKEGFSSNTPLIVYETDKKNNGKITVPQ